VAAAEVKDESVLGSCSSGAMVVRRFSQESSSGLKLRSRSPSPSNERRACRDGGRFALLTLRLPTLLKDGGLRLSSAASAGWDSGLGETESGGLRRVDPSASSNRYAGANLGVNELGSIEFPNS
jgi:hypothetical protein